MVEIKFTIPDTKTALRISNAFKYIWAIPEIDGTPEYTDLEWFKKKIIEFVKRTVKSSERRKLIKETVQNAEDIIE